MTSLPLPDAALPPVVLPVEWAAAYEEMLVREKELTRARDALAAQRRRMPMTRVGTDYRFVGPEGEVGLLDLFGDRRKDRIGALKARMGWAGTPWFTLVGDDFSRDFGVPETFGINVFLRDDHDRVHRTDVVNGRGVEPLLPTLSMFDLTPLGRQETWEDSPEGRPQLPPYRAERHDEYA